MIRGWLACLYVCRVESRNLRVSQCAMWDFNKHRSNTVRSLNFFDIECEFLRRREEIERVGWLALDFGPRRSAIFGRISPWPGSSRLYQFQEIVKFKFIIGLKSLKAARASTTSIRSEFRVFSRAGAGVCVAASASSLSHALPALASPPLPPHLSSLNSSFSLLRLLQLPSTHRQLRVNQHTMIIERKNDFENYKIFH